MVNWFLTGMLSSTMSSPQESHPVFTTARAQVFGA